MEAQETHIEYLSQEEWDEFLVLTDLQGEEIVDNEVTIYEDEECKTPLITYKLKI